MKLILDMLKNTFHRGLTSALLLSVSLGLAGCATGPDFKRPESPKDGSYAPRAMSAETASAPVMAGATQRFDIGKDIPYDWWTLFRSPQLDALITRAFKANPDIVSAQAALQQAQEYVAAQRGYFYPTVGVSYSPSRTKLAGNFGGNSPGQQGNGQVIQTYSTPNGLPPYNAPVYYNFHTAQLTVGFVPDVFGGNRRQVESLVAQADLQRYQLEAAYISLASNIVAAALQEASLHAQIAAMEKLVAANQENLDIMQKRLQLGDVSPLDVASQQAIYAQSEQALVPLRLQLEKTRDLIRALLGNPPDADVPETFDLAMLHLPEDLPLSLPSKVVEQRPDIRAVEEHLHAASAQYGVSIASLMPQFSISGDVGGMASTPGWMFRTGGGFFNLTVDIAYTIFDGGQLRAQSRAANDALEQAGAQYRSTVIAALQNVADTLHTIQSDAESLKMAAMNEQAMQQVRDLTRKQYETGYVSYQTLLFAEQGYQQAEIVLIQAQTNRFGDTAALYQALGGGWWNRTDKSEVTKVSYANDAKGDVAK